MSELKAYIAPTADGTGLADYYLKSAADAVIANRDYEIKKLKDSISKLLNDKTEQIIDEVMQKALIYGEGFVRVEDMMKLIAELRHQKFKRCLAIAKWCQDKLDVTYGFRYKHFEKWKWRWLELAEKFKEVNNA